MTLQQIAEQAMDYLDSVGVAAEWWIDDTKMTYREMLFVQTDKFTFTQIGKMDNDDFDTHLLRNDMLYGIAIHYPQKSPN